jgi:ABC-type transport system involved in multi-copper enzyme maturation permease subunit
LIDHKSERLGFDIFSTAYTLMPYAAITFLLAVATRSAVAAIGGCTAYGLIVESLLDQTLMLLPERFGEAARYLPANLMQSVLKHSWTPPALMEDISPSLLGSSQAALGIAIWTLVLFGLALWIFRRQGFSG